MISDPLLGSIPKPYALHRRCTGETKKLEKKNTPPLVLPTFQQPRLILTWKPPCCTTPPPTKLLVF